MRERTLPLTLALAVATLPLFTTACAHGDAGAGGYVVAPASAAEPASHDLAWGAVLARYMARSAEPAILFSEKKQVQSKLDDLQKTDRVAYVVVRSAQGETLGQWGALPAGLTLPHVGKQELQQAKDELGLVQVPVFSSYDASEFLGDLVLVVRAG
ncbi:MAG: hypothetical protein P1V51_05280 [Deltaproteobacteria bacterium]|nr:hypothetical protein [Deltaproteobacteria bacterium]